MTPPGRVAGLVVAAGSGERLGAGVPKALVELAGVPLLARSARALLDSGAIGGVIAVVGAGDERRAAAALAAAGVRPRAVCAGGATRQASVACGLARLAPSDEVVAVHDAARPLASPALVARVVAALAPPVVAVAPGLPVVDTLKRVDPGTREVLGTADRDGLWAVQTPQVFARDALEHAHAAAAHAVTDDLALVEASGGLVRLVPGERRNLKVTYPEDLELAALLLAGAAP